MGGVGGAGGRLCKGGEGLTCQGWCVGDSDEEIVGLLMIEGGQVARLSAEGMLSKVQAELARLRCAHFEPVLVYQSLPACWYCNSLSLIPSRLCLQ